MKKIFKSIALASLGLAVLFSCTKNEPVAGTADGNGLMELSVTGVLGEYKTAEGTKASLVNTPRVGWNGDEIVHVFQQSDGTYLGSLTSSVKSTGASVATLGGTITSGKGTLVFVYTNVTEFSPTKEKTYKSLEISLATQGTDTPFVVYGTAESSGTESVSGLVVNFSFATSVVSTYAAGLPASTAVTQAELSGINTKCVLRISNLNVSGDTSGTITKTAGIGNTDTEGQVLFEIAVPVSYPEYSGRSIVFTIDSETYTAGFSGAAIAAGKAYSAMSVNHTAEFVAFDKTADTVFAGSSKTLTATVYPLKSNQELTWESDNTTVATVNETGIVTGVAAGTATITATTTNSGKTASCTVTVKEREYVEIGGLKWATCNIGADSPTDYGWYFSWGNTTGYIHDGLKWVEASDGTTLLRDDGSFSESNYSYTIGYNLSEDISPASEYDAARINWGGGWRMPTFDDFKNLAKQCFLEWTEDYNVTGVKGLIVWEAKNDDAGWFKPSTANKGRQIKEDGSEYDYEEDHTFTNTYTIGTDSHLFFPAAGCGEYTSFYNIYYSYYWSSTLYSDATGRAYSFCFQSDGVNLQTHYERSHGMPVRPVSDL